MTPPLRGLLAIVSLGIAEGEQQISQQRKHILELQKAGLPTVEQQKTLDVIHVLVSSMRDNQLMIERLMSGATEH